MQVMAQAPCRVDLAGGTLDIWPLYVYHPNAVTLNFAVNVYTYCRLVPRTGRGIRLRSRDQKIDETYDSLDILMKAPRHRHPLAAHVVKYFQPEGAIEVETDSESPQGAGISGSSAMLVSAVSAFNQYCRTGYSLEKIREIAQNIEAQVVQVPTGCQDYYPALYGGVNAIHLTLAGIQRKRLAIDPRELNRRFVLAYTGKPRHSGINNWEVTKRHIDGDRRVRRNFARIALIASSMRIALEKGDWRETARLLRQEWEHRKKNAPSITTPFLDELVLAARRAGAAAAKVCGAGGGGCAVFLCEPPDRERVARTLAAAGAQVLPVSVAGEGVTVRVTS